MWRPTRGDAASVGRPQRPHDLVERLEIARDHPIVADFSVAVTLGDRDVDRFLVDIQPYEHATVPHDLPPRVTSCEASDTPHHSRRDEGSVNYFVLCGSVSAPTTTLAAAEQAPLNRGVRAGDRRLSAHAEAVTVIMSSQTQSKTRRISCHRRIAAF